MLTVPDLVLSDTVREFDSLLVLVVVFRIFVKLLCLEEMFGQWTPNDICSRFLFSLVL